MRDDYLSLEIENLAYYSTEVIILISGVTSHTISAFMERKTQYKEG